MKLLTRNEFRAAVFERDGNHCVICGGYTDLCVHHIVERKLFKLPHELGGYFLSNGATLCPKCHIDAEKTMLSCDVIRMAARISEVVLPEHFANQKVDKWGNIILPNGKRVKGELFLSCQKILADVMYLFLTN
jgi:hypothetical protein